MKDVKETRVGSVCRLRKPKDYCKERTDGEREWKEGFNSGRGPARWRMEVEPKEKKDAHSKGAREETNDLWYEVKREMGEKKQVCEEGEGGLKSGNAAIPLDPHWRARLIDPTEARRLVAQGRGKLETRPS